VHVGVEQLLVNTGQHTDLVVSLHDQRRMRAVERNVRLLGGVFHLGGVIGEHGELRARRSEGNRRDGDEPKGTAVMATRFTFSSARLESTSYPTPGASLTVA
jgi:hypothetical protein